MEKSFDLGALLQNHEKKHKNKPVQFVSVAGGVKNRLESSIRYRKSTRFSVFDKIRNLPRCESPVPIPELQKKIELRRKQLEKWKEEKEKKKKEVSLQKKKPFLVGIVQNPLKYVPPPFQPMPSTSGRVTRSQSVMNNLNYVKKTSKTENKSKFSVQSFAPENAVFHPPVLKNLVKLPTLSPSKKTNMKFDKNSVENPSIKRKGKTVKDKASKQFKPKVLRSNLQSKKEQTSKIKGPTSVHSTSPSSSSVDLSKEVLPILKLRTPRKSWQGKQKMVTPKNVPKSEFSSEQKLRSPKLIDIPMTPEQISKISQKISPFVTLSRGKDNARKEIKKKIKEGVLDLCEMDSVEHFRRQLDTEISRMTEMCVAWEKILDQIVLPESVQETVLCAVGQARLLMSQKLQQFASLLSRCENPTPNTAVVTPTDLHGFWDMVFMQIENVDMRFHKLEVMRSRGWSEERPLLSCSVDVPHEPRLNGPATRPAARTSARPTARLTARPAATSRIKDLIAAARRAKQAQAPEPPSIESKTIDMGFCCIQSPLRSPLPATPTRSSLRKAVLSNETKKSANRKCASLAMWRASLMGKDSANEEPNLITFTPVHLKATPARSDLKNKPSTKKCAKKSIKVVLCDESDTEFQNTSINMDEPACDTEGRILDIGTQKTNHNADSAISSMDVENEMEKENKGKRKFQLIRQDATENRSPVLTRSRLKSIPTPIENSDKRSSRKQKSLKEIVRSDDENIKTPRRSSKKTLNKEVL